ncbi:unnamed protein product [Prunus brigantina]
MFLRIAVSSPTTKPGHLMRSHGQRRRGIDQNKRPRFAEIYGGHTTMLHDPKC